MLLTVTLLSAPSLLSLSAAEENIPESVLETVGTMAAAYVYHAHQELGYLAEALINGTSPDKIVRPQVHVMSALTKLTDEQLEKMAKSPLSEADNNSIAELRKIIRLLGEQSKDLIAYLETQKPAPLDGSSSIGPTRGSRSSGS